MNNPLQPSATLPVFRAAWIVTAVFILSNAATPLYTHWQQSLGFASGTLTLIFSCYILGLLLTLAVAGQLADHYGRKALLLPGLVIAIIAALLFEHADSVAMLMLARLLSGISVGIVVSAGMANVVEQACEQRRSFASLIASVSMVLGAGTGPLLAGVIAQYLPDPVDTVFNVEIGLLSLALLVVLRQPHRKLGTGGFRPKLPSVAREHLGVVALGVSFFGPGLTSTCFVLALGPKLLASLLHANSPLIAGSMAFVMFLTAVGVQFAAKKREMTQVFVLSGIATLLSMGSLWIALQLDSAAWLIGAAMLAGAGQGLGQLGGLTLIALHIVPQRRAEANAIFNIGGYVPAGIIAVVTGYLIDLFGIHVAISVLAGVIGTLAVLALAVLLGSRRSQGRDTGQPA
ncbi:MFS transporter [Pseudomonas sp. NPDC087358]|uniref:MFS transporter n=1 Tax=Pseudomonas sp. NPDC087358 TaxID=3364439 RepID=UPI00384FADD0